MAYNYSVREHDGSAELYIDRKDKGLNKAIFDELHAKKAEIESAFGGELSWERMDSKQACRIRKRIDVGGWRDEDRWPEVHKAGPT